MRSLARLLLVAALATPLVGAAPSALGETVDDPGAPVTVVVALAGTLGSVPKADRPAAAQAAQNQVLDALDGSAPRDVTHLTTGNVVVATVTQAQRQALAADPRVAAVGVDMEVPEPVAPTDASSLTSTAEQTLAAAAAAPVGTLPPVDVPADVCTGTEARPQLEPEALGTMNVVSDDPDALTAAAAGYDGTGVTVGIITTNLDPQATDFIRDGSSVVVDYKAYGAGGVDDTGEAVEAFGDASSIGAQGVVPYDLADVVNPGAATLPGGHCWIRVVGVAPAARMVVSDVQDRGPGNISISGFLQAVDYSVSVAGVDILSMSLGFPIVPDVGLRSAIQAVTAAAVDAGVTVVVSSGDAGPNNTIEVPAATPGVISVGATTTPRLYAQVGGLGINRFGNGTRSDGATAFFSSAGTTMSGRTIDLVAPGFAGWSMCAAQPRFQGCDAVGDASRASDLVPFAGTSQSAPFVAGIAALVVQAYRDGHGGADPSPDQVRRVLTGTATDLGLPADLQGNGQVDARAAVLAARNLPAADLVATLPTPAADPSDTLVADVDQLTATRGGDLPVAVTVTNTATTPVALDDLALTEDTVATRSTQPVSFASDAPAFLDGAVSFAKPGVIEPLVATTLSVTVPDGVPWARLQVLSDALDGADASFVQVSAFAPDGAFVNGGRSTSGIQLVLPNPQSGTWTVVVQAHQAAPFTGVLALDLARRTVVAEPTASAPVLAPGASAVVRTVLPAPTSPGNRITTLRIADRLTVPVVLRRPVDLTTGDTATVSTPLLPTAGREGSAQQTATWDVDVPAGREAFTAVVASGVAAEADAVLVLVDPDGYPASISTTEDPNSPDSATAGIQGTVARPAAGRWTVHVLIYDALYPGQAALGVPLTVAFALDATRPVAGGLPVGEVAQGTDLPVTLQITNPGADTLQLLGDARTDAVTDVTLTPVFGGGPVALPVATGQAQPLYVVPPFSTALSAAATADVPTVLGLYDASGSRNAISAPGTSPAVAVSDRPTPGAWTAQFGVPGSVVDSAPTGSAEVRATVRTAAYDTTVTGTDGNAWMSGGGPEGPLVTVAPGATGTLTAVLHADAPVGTRVQGFLAVETPPWVAVEEPFLTAETSTGDVLAVFPYSYLVVAPPEPTTAPSTPTTEPAPTSAVAPTDAGSTPASTTTTTTVTASTTTVTATTGEAVGPLAYTGTDARTPGVWGVGMLAVGAGLAVAARRRRAPGRH